MTVCRALNYNVRNRKGDESPAEMSLPPVLSVGTLQGWLAGTPVPKPRNSFKETEGVLSACPTKPRETHTTLPFSTPLEGEKTGKCFLLHSLAPGVSHATGTGSGSKGPCRGQLEQERHLRDTLHVAPAEYVILCDRNSSLLAQVFSDFPRFLLPNLTMPVKTSPKPAVHSHECKSNV